MPSEAANVIKRIIWKQTNNIKTEIMARGYIEIGFSLIEFTNNLISMIMYSNIQNKIKENSDINLYFEKSSWRFFSQDSGKANYAFLKIYLQIVQQLLIKDEDNIHLYENMESYVTHKSFNMDYSDVEDDDLLNSLMSLTVYMILGKNRNEQDIRVKILLRIISNLLTFPESKTFEKDNKLFAFSMFLLSHNHKAIAREFLKKLDSQNFSEVVHLIHLLKPAYISTEDIREFPCISNEAQKWINQTANQLTSENDANRYDSLYSRVIFYMVSLVENDQDKIKQIKLKVIDEEICPLSLLVLGLESNPNDDELKTIIRAYIDANQSNNNNFDKLFFLEFLTSRMGKDGVRDFVKDAITHLLDDSSYIGTVEINHINMLYCFILKQGLLDEEMQQLFNKFNENDFTISKEALLIPCLDKTSLTSILTPENNDYDLIEKRSLDFINNLMALQSLFSALQDELPLPLNNYSSPSTLIFQYGLDNKKERDAFDNFYSLAKRIKSNNPEDLNIDRLLNKFNEKIFNLYSIMGEDAFTFLKKLIKSSLLPLERFLINYQIITEATPIIAKTLSKFKGEHNIVCNTLITVGSLLLFLRSMQPPYRQNDSQEELNAILNETIDENDSPALTNDKLQNLVAKLYLEKLGLPLSKEVYKNLQTKLKIHELTLLVIGRSKMENDTYKDVFDEMLKHDFMPNQSFDHMLHDENQESDLGRRLAIHNNQIRNELKNAGINVDLAFSYRNEKSFTPQVTAKKLALNMLTCAIWSDLENVQQSLHSLMNDGKYSSEEKLIKGILNSIDNCKKQILKGKLPGPLDENNTVFLNRIKNNVKLIIDLNKPLEKLKQHLNQKLGISAGSFFEHSNHLADRLTTFQGHSNTHLKFFTTSSSQATTYNIKHWDKSQCNTYLLGEYLSCCLSPTGGQFPAIVQRRMDDAMQMHVVEDNNTHEPIAGNWLFWAKDKKTGEVYLVANFFEIRSSIGLNAPLRDEIIQQLVSFTAEYAEKAGAKKFLIRPLSYGLIPDFNKTLKKDNIEIEKVGGFFSMNEYEGEDKTCKQYYLSALDIKEFYVHPYEQSVQQTPEILSSGFV